MIIKKGNNHFTKNPELLIEEMIVVLTRHTTMRSCSAAGVYVIFRNSVCTHTQKEIRSLKILRITLLA